MNNIYISGTQGSGKSTLLQEYVAKHEGIVLPKIRMPNFEEPLHRLLVRVPRYYGEHLRMSKSSQIVLGDRCMYDNYAYANAFLKLGWISKIEHQLHYDLVGTYFDAKTLPKNIVFIDSELDWVKERLVERQKTKRTKWMENNLPYLEAVHESFREVYQSVDANVLHLTECDLEKRLAQVNQFVTNGRS